MKEMNKEALETKDVFQVRDIYEKMNQLSPFFDIVRLVDPTDFSVVTMRPDGTLGRQPERCYDVWGRSDRCNNCTSGLCQAKGCSIFKKEEMPQRTFNIVSRPVHVTMLDGATKPFVLEIVSGTPKENAVERDTVLVVEDNLVNRRILRRLLEKNYRVQEAENGLLGLKRLCAESQRIAAVVLDLTMPVLDGYQTLREMQKEPQLRSIPVLIATGDESKETERSCLSAGAWDFIKKPYDGDILLSRLKNIIGRSNYDEAERVRYMSEHDPVTGLYNRVRLFNASRALLERYPEEQMAIIRFDIDQFGLFNSLFGEEQGNRLLRYIADLIRKDITMLPYAAYGRIEGDVFGLCIPYHDDLMNMVVERVQELLAGYNPAYYIKPSFGVYMVTDRTVPVEIMFQRAKLASEKCKTRYRTYLAFYDEEMSARLKADQEIMNEAPRALENHEFVVYLQPKYNIKTETPCGAEALVRWKHPTQGMIPPGKFIPAFEKNGFVSEVDHNVWEQVCAMLGTWLAEGRDPFPISVNISRVDAYNPNLPDVFSGLIEKYHVPPALLPLELTESAYMGNPDQMMRTVNELHRRGFTIMMDDFGSGYSSLNTLKEIPVDILKVDMNFLQEGDKGGRSEKILASVISMAGWLELPVIVEGVETREQKVFLESVGCEFVQGYYYARPMPVEEYLTLTDSIPPPPPVQQGNLVEADMNRLGQTRAGHEFEESPLPATIIARRMDGTFRVLRANRAYLAQTGLTESGLSSDAARKRYSRETMGWIQAAFDEATDTRDTAECEIQQFTAAGMLGWVQMRLRWLGKAGQEHILLAQFRDITAEKTLESTLFDTKMLSHDEEARPCVLVVDDSEMSRTLLRGVFAPHFRVEEAVDGVQGLEKLAQCNPAIVLLDMVMPNMDGGAFLQHKNADARLRNIPVVAISAEHEEKLQRDALQLGVRDYITKPFVPEVAAQRIRNVLGGSLRMWGLSHPDDNESKT